MKDYPIQFIVDDRMGLKNPCPLTLPKGWEVTPSVTDIRKPHDIVPCRIKRTPTKQWVKAWIKKYRKALERLSK